MLKKRNMLKKFISRQPDIEVNVVPTKKEYGATVAAGVTHQDKNQILEEYQEAIVKEKGSVMSSWVNSYPRTSDVC